MSVREANKEKRELVYKILSERPGIHSSGVKDILTREYNIEIDNKQIYNWVSLFKLKNKNSRVSNSTLSATGNFWAGLIESGKDGTVFADGMLELCQRLKDTELNLQGVKEQVEVDQDRIEQLVKENDLLRAECDKLQRMSMQRLTAAASIRGAMVINGD
jgi:hypothetical protein